MSRYKFIITDNKVICLSSYMGRTVRGVAKCSPNDEFNEEFGKKLAQARCDYKAAQKRYERAMQKNNEAEDALYAAEQYSDKMDNYLWEAEEAFDDATMTLMELLDSEADAHPFQKEN